MEISYYKDLGHNYLVMEIDEPDRDNYQFRMIEQNSLKRLLPCSIHNLNDGVFLYYETDSRISLRSMTEKGGLKLEDIRELISDLKEAGDEAREYLLDPSGILLSQEFIYKDTASGRYFFLFCPVSDGHYGFDGLCQELTQLVDTSDHKAADLVFSLCEASMNGGVLPADALAGLDKISLRRDITEEEAAEIYPEKKISAGDRASAGEENAMAGYTGAGALSEADAAWYGERDEEEEAGIGRILISILFLAVTGALLSLRVFYTLTRLENTLDIAGAFICALLGIYGLAGVFMHRRAHEDEDVLSIPLSAAGGARAVYPSQALPPGADVGENGESEVTVRFDRGRVVNIAYSSAEG